MKWRVPGPNLTSQYHSRPDLNQNCISAAFSSTHHRYLCHSTSNASVHNSLNHERNTIGKAWQCNFFQYFDLNEVLKKHFNTVLPSQETNVLLKIPT